MAGRPIDEKIVVMKLDNSDFTKKASETTGLFGKITNAMNKIPGVNLGKTVTDLNGINNAAKDTQMSKLASAVQGVSQKFSALNVVAMTALGTITSMATQSGLAMAKSLTFDQVTSGFQEYEQKIGAIGTMLSNTEWAGSDLEDVKKTLADLNAYADKTVYSFGDMTENIGRFTSAGVRLEDSAIAIKGLGNLAAASGSNVEQLNMAMYQSSQALASGKLNLEDWNSLVNAGMAGKKTQDALVKTAKEMGINVDLSNGFRNSIQKGWLTSEVFLKTLQKFGEDKSLTKAATSVRTFSALMDSTKESIGSGWATTFENIFGDFDEATNLFTKLSASIGGHFNKSAQKRNNFVKQFADYGGVQNLFTGIANAAKPIAQIMNAIGNGFKAAFPPKTAEQVFWLARSFKEFTAGLKMSTSTVQKLTTIFQGAFSIFNTAWIIVKQLGSAFLNMIPSGVGGSILDILVKVANMAIAFNKSVKEGNALTGTISVLGKIFGAFGQAISKVGEVVFGFSGTLIEGLGGALDWIMKKLKPIGESFKNAFGSLDGGDILGAGALTGIFLIVQKIFGFFNKAEGGFGDIVDNITETLEGVSDSINNFANGIKYANLLVIAVAIGILAASLKTLEGIKVADISKSITGLAGALAVMIGGMMLMDKFKVSGSLGTSVTLIALATAVLIMASALKKISDLNPSELSRGIAGIFGVVTALSLGMIAMSRLGGKLKVSSLQLIALAGALYILADVVKTLSSINAGALIKSISAMGVMFLELAIFLRIANKTKFGPGSAIGVLAIAGAISIMAGALKKIAGLNVGELVKGLSTIGILLAEIAIFSKVVSGPSMLLAGPGLLMLAIAINAMVPPIKALGNMSIGELAKGLTALAVALTIVSVAAFALTTSIVGAAGLLVMAGALTLLMIPIKMFASMTWGELTKGFVGLAGGLTLVAVASMLLSPAVLPMLGFGAALLLVGAAALAVGAGIGLFAVGLTTLATLTAGSIGAIVASLNLLLKGFGELIPAAVKFIVDLGTQLLNGLNTLVPKLVNTIANIIISLMQTISDKLPEFIRLGSEILIKLMDGLAEYLPKLINSGMNLIVQFIDGLAQAIEDNGPKMTSAFMNLMGEILILVVDTGVQMITAMFGWIPGVKEAATSIGKNAEKYIRDNFKAKDVGNTKGKEFSSGLGSKTGDAQSAGKKIASAGKTGAGSIKMKDTGANFGSGFASGISSKLPAVISAAKSMAKAASDKVKSWLDIHSPSRVTRGFGKFFGDGLALGIKDKTKTVAQSAASLATTATKSVNSFLQAFNPQPEDNHLHFKAVVDYETVDPSKFGKIAPIGIQPNVSATSSMIPSIVRANSAKAMSLSQNGNNSAMIKQQDQQIELLKQQNGLLSGIYGKDNSVYLDGKAMYNSNKTIQNTQTTIRNMFKGVSAT